MVHDYVRSALAPLAELAPEHAEAAFAELEEKAREELKAEGMNAAQARFTRELDLRYTGQGYELRTPLEGLFDTHLTAASLADVRTRFDERHAQIHGHAARERGVELVSYRLRVRVAVPKYKPVAEAPPPSPRGIEGAIKGRRRIHLPEGDSAHAILYERDQLEIGALVSGPAIVEQLDATTVIPPGWSGSVDGFRNLILRRES